MFGWRLADSQQPPTSSSAVRTAPATPRHDVFARADSSSSQLTGKEVMSFAVEEAFGRSAGGLPTGGEGAKGGRGAFLGGFQISSYKTRYEGHSARTVPITLATLFKSLRALVKLR